MMPMMTPNKPSALPKISTTRIFTKRVAFCASESAALLPTIPTQTLHASESNRHAFIIYKSNKEMQIFQQLCNCGDGSRYYTIYTSPYQSGAALQIIQKLTRMPDLPSL